MFRKKTKETKGASGASAKPKWMYFDSLSFLIPMMKPRSTTGNLPVSDPSMSQVLEEHEGEASNENDFTQHDEDIADIDDSEEENVSQTNTQISTPVGPKPQQKTPKRKQPPSLQNEALDLERRKVQLMEARFAVPQTNPAEDEDLSFFKSLLPSIKKLPDIRRMKLRSKILNCVITELETHEQNTSWPSTAASLPPRCPSGSGHYSHSYASSSENSSSIPPPYPNQHSGQAEKNFPDLY